MDNDPTLKIEGQVVTHGEAHISKWITTSGKTVFSTGTHGNLPSEECSEADIERIAEKPNKDEKRIQEKLAWQFSNVRSTQT